MGHQDKFLSLISEESELFSETCEMMLHSKVESGRKFLCAMNNVVEYCQSQSAIGKDGVNYHIIYLSATPEWARELLVRFFIHKIAFTSSDRFIQIAKEKTPTTIYLPEKTTPKYIKQLYAERKYYNKFIRLFKDKVLPENIGKKSLFVLQEKDVLTRKQDKNPWLEQLYTDNLFDSRRNVVVNTSETAHDIESLLRMNRNNVPNIENVFIFHSQNRGKITYSYNRQQLERLNKYGVGIKNCFVFYLTERPFRLFHTQDNVKYTLSSNLLNQEIKRFDAFDGFITFTPAETDRMFNRKSGSSFYVIDSPEREFFTADIDSYFDELAHNYKIKNALSLAFSDATQECFLKECESATDLKEWNEIMPFLNFYKQFWNEEIQPTIEEKIQGCSSVAFALPNWATAEQKRALKACFQKEFRKVFIIDYDKIKYGVSADIVVLFAFRYTDSKYKTYPNSFDPLPLLEGQKGLTIINRLTHNRYYEWNKHFYEKSFNGLLYSDFRVDALGWSKRILHRPLLPDIFDNIDEAEADAREYMAEKCVVQFENGKIKPLAASRVIYHNGTTYCISSLKDLPFEEGIEIQMLDEIVEQIKDSLIKKSDNTLKAEEYIRKDESYGLTEEQISSDIELWKYLLKRKVEESSIEEAYNAIFPNEKEISRRGFERWLDFDYPMILPRSRRSQNSLLTYLGFKLGGPYHRVILTKKLMRNSNTRLLNSQIESLLQSILTVSKFVDEDYPELFEEHSEILTLLEIGSAAEVNTLVELLDIRLKKIISIKYDSNKA